MTPPPLVVVDARRAWEAAGCDGQAGVGFYEHLPRIADRAVRIAVVHSGALNKDDFDPALDRHDEDPYELLVQFSGDVVQTDVGPDGRGPLGNGRVVVTRADAHCHLARFLEHYAATGLADPWIFTGRDPAPAAAPPAPQARPDRVPLTLGPEGGARLALASDGTIDPFATLDALAGVDPAAPVVLQETYRPGSPGDGLRLFERLRLGAFWSDAARRPVVLQSDGPLDNDPGRQPLYTAGVAVAEPGGPLPAAPPPISEADHRRMLDGLRLPLPYVGTPHALANEWGALRLRYGVRALRGEPLDGWFRESARALDRSYYWLLLGRLYLAGDWRDPADPAAWDRWTRFLKRRRPTVLAVDDEMATAGWGGALDEAFDHSDRLTTLAYTDGFADGVRAAAEDPTLDLLLTDLRMTSGDRATGEAADRVAVAGLTGTALIRRLKVGCGPTGPSRPTLPAVVFTASNKSWTYRQLADAGADAYWVKESPEISPDHAATVESARALLRYAEDAVATHDERAFLWAFRDDVLALVNDPARTRPFASVPGASPAGVVGHLQAVARFAQQAYGYLAVPETAHRRAAFDQDTTDVAFLSLWSAVDDLLRLRYVDAGRHPRAFSVLVPGYERPETYWAADRWPDTDGVNPDLEARVDDRRQQYLAPDRDRDRDRTPRLGLETQHVEVLFELSGRRYNPDWRRGTARWDRFLRARELRNDLVHGSAQERPSAALGDLESLVSVWRWLLGL